MTVNEEHSPTGAEESVLNTFKNERKTYQSSRMTPKLIRDRFDQEVMIGDGDAPSKQTVNFALKQLTAAGWVKKVTDGLYEFVEDPREAPADD
jgi:hypothetical protein